MCKMIPLLFFILALMAPVLHAQQQKLVITGKALQVSDQTTIPVGMFGTHAVPLNDERVKDWGIELDRKMFYGPHKPYLIEGVKVKVNKKGRKRYSGTPEDVKMIIECWYDRYQPALQLTKPDWKEYLEKAGREYGEASKTTGQQHYVEFWNEPYLNWATKPGVNYHGRFFNWKEAKAGEPVKKNGKVFDKNLVWDKKRFYAYRDGRHLDYVASSKIPAWGKEGEEVKLTGAPGKVKLMEGGEMILSGRKFILRKEWIAKDLTQKHYWSSAVNRRLYLEQLDAFGRALKDANPEVKFAAGWGFNFFNEGWAVWHTLIKPTIDHSHEYIDALHEHHYGGDTRMVGAAYEVAWNYTKGTYGRDLDFWNTEAGGHLDPEQPGNAKPYNAGGPLQKAQGAYTYMMKDISYLLSYMPEKAQARAAHHSHYTAGGDEMGFKMFKPLRGRLMEVQSGIPNVWAVASVNEQNQLVVVMFNNNRGPREFTLELFAPQGTKVIAETHDRVVVQDEKLVIKSEEKKLIGTITKVHRKLKVPKQEALRLVFQLDQKPALKEIVKRKQIANPIVLKPFYGKGGVVYDFKVDAADLKKVKKAYLRTVTWGPRGKFSAFVNAEEVSLNFTQGILQDHPIETQLLKTMNRISFGEYPDVKATMMSISLILEFEPE